jgi:hypothetical protein
MTKREKTLAGLVGLLALAIVSWIVLDRLTGAFDYRTQQIANLRDQLYEQEAIVRRGQKAAQEMTEFQKQSLPADRPLARSLYQNWLLDLAEQKIDFREVNVGAQPGRPVGEVYYQHKFLLTCQGDLDQLSQFLYDFYRVGYLHRINRLSIKPIPRTKLLTLVLTIEALSLNRAESPQQLDPPPGSRLALSDRNEYRQIITQRNLLSPANRSPKLRVSDQLNGTTGNRVSFAAKASDDDELDRLSFALEEAPEGAQLDPTSGEFNWTPAAPGDYRFVVRVDDDGLPAKSDRVEIRLAVTPPPPPPPPPPTAPPPPPPPSFDPATEAVVTGIIEALGKRQFFVTIRTDGRILRLQEGDNLSVGSVKGIVRQIGTEQVEIETEQGKRIQIKLGSPLQST